MMKRIPEALIISLQVAGFVAAIVFLVFFNRWLFVSAFGIHFAGDLLRYLKDGL